VRNGRPAFARATAWQAEGRLLDLKLDCFDELIVQVDLGLIIAGRERVVVRQAKIDSVRLFHAFDRLGRDLDFFLENLFVFRSPGVDDRPDRFYVRSDFWLAQKNQDGERVVGLEAFDRLESVFDFAGQNRFLDRYVFVGS